MNTKSTLSREDLNRILILLLKELDGSGTIIEICRLFWKKYGHNISQNEDIFYTWQYDIRWSASVLREQGILKLSSRSNHVVDSVKYSPFGVWELSDEYKK
ncbi:hypothetical protein N7603_04945 [Acholeplasma vituli]|uniref:Restriction system protein Mrr-like N-terminal domain-containing protein n=1 Tax=Paracholeplasma vituli TaxID=69473 RepID=A0ABT2PVL8_9MOLU|nr:hypothetical protein [Paracholeplasma vituli]MCU0104998.1 hypothetical protein [Paracholeplasma vituli]